MYNETERFWRWLGKGLLIGFLLLGVVVGMIIAGVARAEGADLLIRATNDLLPTPPATDAVPINPLENPVVAIVVSLLFVVGLPGTIYLCALFLDWLEDAGIKPTRLTKRILGIVAGFITAGLAELLGFLSYPALEQYPVWLRVVGLGLVFGLYAGGRISADQQAQKKALKLADQTYAGGEFGDGEPRVGQAQDYA
jgi:hypothetical protein